MTEPIIFGVLLVLGIYVAMKVAKMLIRLAIFVTLALAFYFFVYPKITEFLQ